MTQEFIQYAFKQNIASDYSMARTEHLEEKCLTGLSALPKGTVLCPSWGDSVCE